MNTCISYIYRDADNYKVYNECIVEGQITPEQKANILASLDEGEYFIPHKVGLPERRFDEFDPQSDHDWFELGEYSFEDTPSEPTVPLSVQDLEKAFLQCKGKWMEESLAQRAPVTTLENQIDRVAEDDSNPWSQIFEARSLEEKQDKGALAEKIQNARMRRGVPESKFPKDNMLEK